MFPQGRPFPVIGLELGVEGGGGGGSCAVHIFVYMYGVCVGGRVRQEFWEKRNQSQTSLERGKYAGWFSCLANVYTASVAGRFCTQMHVALTSCSLSYFLDEIDHAHVGSFSEPLYP